MARFLSDIFEASHKKYAALEARFESDTSMTMDEYELELDAIGRWEEKMLDAWEARCLKDIAYSAFMSASRYR
jgi:hypothetical protein